MSWISVDQKLIGGKLRELHKEIECSRNEAIGILIGLWLWGMDNANADGLLRGCGREDIEEQISIGADKRYEPEKAYDALVSGGWLEERDGGIYIHDWEDWRYHYNKWVADKERNKERQKRFRERHAEDNANSNGRSNVTDDTKPQAEPEKQEEQTKRKARDYSATGFVEFWNIYPRKEDKAEAYQCYKARLKDGYTPDELILAARKYADLCKRKRYEKEYIKKAKRFIGANGSFTELIEIAPETEPKRKEGENPFL